MPTKIQGQDVIQPVAADSDALDALDAVLSRVPASTFFCLSGPDTAPIELPESVCRALRDAARILRHGAAVVISPLQRRLSTTEAGDLLGVSRQYLTRLIDKGEIPCDRTGRHRRLKLSDILDYKRRRDEARGAFMDDLTAESADGGYYD